MNRIDFAQTFATAAHAGQVRPYTGEPYIGHPARVVGILQQYLPDARWPGQLGRDSLVCAAWLHDVIEDCSITHDAIVQSFNGYVGALVWELTKPNEPLSQGGMIIKACDLIDNIGMIADVAPPDQAREYLRKKADQVLRIASSLDATYPELAEALARAFWRNWSAVA